MRDAAVGLGVGVHRVTHEVIECGLSDLAVIRVISPWPSRPGLWDSEADAESELLTWKGLLEM